LVDRVQNPDCTALIPTPTADLDCNPLYKVKNIRPIDGSRPGPLCTFANLDAVNTVARTPSSQGVIVTDAAGRACKARKRAGDQWWMFYRTCCSPFERFGQPGDKLRTQMTLVVDRGNGQCVTNPV